LLISIQSRASITREQTRRTLYGYYISNNSINYSGHDCASRAVIFYLSNQVAGDIKSNPISVESDKLYPLQII